MRYLVLAALAPLALSLVDARPAHAYWQCVGPEVACGGSHASSAVKAAKRAKAARYEQRREKASRAKVASHTATRHERVAKARSNYTGGSGGMSGLASYYGGGGMTASGARFNPGAMTAAHRSLPFGTRVLVTASNGRSVTVTINDRGPFVKGRVIDLSTAAARELGITGAGVAPVSLSVVGGG